MDEKRELRREINRLLAIIVLWAMSFTGFGAGIELDPNTQQNANINTAPNGVPVINISTPGRQGTSVNTFREFNVDSRGLEILNNTGVGRGHLSGIVPPNTNLVPGQEARTVVFRVNGSNRSEIEGYISALSPHKINLFIANENGIYANGAGFINVGRAVLTTGKINIQDGDVVSFTAKDGSIIIGEKGLDLTGVERAEIISRTQEITGKIVANGKLDITLGQNDVSLAGVITPIMTADSKPAVALNAGALGSVYSNGQIQIISTEKGVGVNMKAPVISENDLRLKINGNADISQAISKNVVMEAGKITADDIQGINVGITGDSVKAGNITGQNVGISAVSEAAGNKIRAENLKIASKNITGNSFTANDMILKGGNLDVKDIEGRSVKLGADGNLTSSGRITGTELDIDAGNVKGNEIIADRLNIRTAGNTETSRAAANITNIKADNIKAGVLEGSEMTLNADRSITAGAIRSNNLKAVSQKFESVSVEGQNIELDVAGALKNNGKILADTLSIKAGKIENSEITAGRGSITSSGDIEGGKIYSNDISIKGKNVRTDTVESGKTVIKADGEIRNAGKIVSKELDMTAGRIESGNIVSGRAVINADEINGGEITSNELKVKGKNFTAVSKVDAESANFELKEKFTNRGTVSSDSLKVKAKDISNDGKMYGSSAGLSSEGNTVNSGEIETGELKVESAGLENRNSIKANRASVTTAGDTVNNGTVSVNDMTVKARNTVNIGKMEADKLNITSSQATDNRGVISANELTVNTHGFTNSKEISAGKGTINAVGTVRNDDRINSNELTVNAGEIVNSRKIETGKGTFTSAGDIVNNDIMIGNTLNFKGRNLVNGEGRTIFTTRELNAEMTGDIVNRGAELLSQGSMTLKAGTVDNTVGKIRGAGDVSITASRVENKGKAGDLTKYKVYWETWNGKKYNSWQELTDPNGGWQNSWSDWGNVLHQDSESYIMTEGRSIYEAKKRNDWQNGSYVLPSAQDGNIVPLKNKVESEAKTEFAIISGGNLSINASGEVNNTDGIISSDGLTKIDSPRIVNRVTIDTSSPVKLRDGYESLLWSYECKGTNVGGHCHSGRKERLRYNRGIVGYEKVKKIVGYKGKNETPVYKDFWELDEKKYTGIGYVAGQPSVIEGRAVILDTGSIVAESYESAKGKIVTGNPSHSGSVAGQNIQVVKNVSSIEEIKKTGIISVNPAPVSGNSGTGNTGRVEGWNNLLTVSGLYIPSARPDSKYIVENRAEFTDISGFYGSEYFLDRAGFKEDWNRTKLLGDAYYESLLVEQMLTEKLGTRYINGMSGSELMKSLIDNAVSAGKDLNLGQGVALTREQINGLKNDILWYEYQTVNGVRTLVPKIYLSKATLERLETDGRSRIYGTDFTVISSGKEINNRGQKIGSDTGITLIKGSRVTNEMLAGERGEIAGRQIQIEASAGSIENIGGKISGEEINLIAKKGSIVNDGVKQTNGYQIDRNNHTQYETVSNVGEITGNSVYLEADDYNTAGGALLTKNLTLNLKGDINADAMELKGNDRFGDSRNYQKYSSKEHVGSAIVTEKVTGTVGDINLRGSAFIAENGDKINIGNVRVESAVNEYDTESRSGSRGMLSSRKSYTESHTEENAAGNFKIGSNAHISGTVTSVGSNVYLGDNTYVGGKVTTDSRQLHNSYYHEESRRGFNAGAGKGSVSAGYGKNESTYRETGAVNAKSTLHVGNNSVLNSGAEITATDFEHGKIEINNGNVIYGARKDTKDVTSTSKSTNIGITAKVTSPALDRIKQAEGAVKQAKEGDYTGGTVNAINFVTGTVKGLRDNIRSKDGKPARMDDIRKGEFKVNNDFYISGSVNVDFNKSKSESSSHTESAVVTTITGIDKDSGITYNNVDNITYQGTQAKDTKFVYNDVKNITKESVELHNSYRSSSKGMGVGVNTSFGSDGKAKGTTVNVSASRSNSNTDETIHHNGSFTNVDEVHNNTGTMIIRGFNQEGGKVTGNIGKLEIESVQNTSTTTGSSRGVNIGISSLGVPTSGSINTSRTNGSRAYVDKQSSFVIGEGSSLTIGRVENTGAIIGKEGNSSLKIDEYTGKDIHNHDTMKTVGITAGTDGAGVNYENSVKEGITRNTVIGNPEIGRAEGAPINTDISKANETTREEHRKTNVFLEPQTIDYAMNPGKFREDFEVAVLEGKATGEAILKTIENLVNGRKSSDMADPERRTLNEIKESIIRVKTAPQMESIAEAKDLNSPDVLKELGIAAIEKYDPYDPNLPIKVRQRVEKTLEDGKIPGVFYDKTTNKIFVYKGMEDDLEIRAGIAREWKISEDLKDGKGKPNEEGRLKATVAGELAYDDMLKRGREGKTGSISTDRFADAVMDEDSEVTADSLHLNKAETQGSTGNNFNIAGFRRKEAESIEKYKKDEQAKKKKKAEVDKYKNGKKKKSVLENAEDFFQNPEGYLFSSLEQTGNNISYGWTKFINEGKKIFASSDDERHRIDAETEWAKGERDDRNTDSIYRADTPRRKKAEKVDKVKKDISKAKSTTEKKALEERLESVEGVSIWKKADKFVEGGLTSASVTTIAGEALKGVGVAGSIGLAWLFNPVPLGINDRIIRPEYISREEAEYIKERYPEYYSSISQDRYFKVDETRSNLWSTEQKEKVDRGALRFYTEKNNKELETAKEIGGVVGTVAVMGWNAIKSSTTKSSSREIISRENSSKGPEYMKKDSVFINDGTPGGTVKLESQVVGNSNYELSKITNTYNGNTVVKVTNKVTGEIYSFKNFGNTQAGNSLSITNTNTSLVPFNPNASTGMSVTNLSSAGIIGGRVGSNLITSGKSVTTLEAPKNPVVKPFIKPKQDIETVKQPAVTSEKPKTVERNHSQGSSNQIDEKRILEKWGKAADGTNQGKRHFYEYLNEQKDRIPSLEKRLGLSEGTFENSPEGFKNFTEQAERVIKEAKKNKNVRNVNGKSFYYIDGADKIKKGVVVIVKDGKLDSMMPSDIESFHKLK